MLGPPALRKTKQGKLTHKLYKMYHIPGWAFSFWEWTFFFLEKGWKITDWARTEKTLNKGSLVLGHLFWVMTWEHRTFTLDYNSDPLLFRQLRYVICVPIPFFFSCLSERKSHLKPLETDMWAVQDCSQTVHYSDNRLVINLHSC